MAQEYQSIVACLKTALKAKGIKYQQLAEMMGVSELTIKRLLTADDAPLSRLVEICSALNISFFQIARVAGEEREVSFRLKTEQEDFFCDHPGDYAYFTELLSGKTKDEIDKEYQISKRKSSEILKRLETNGVIRRLPFDKIAILYCGTHSWLHGGPLQRKFGHDQHVRFLTKVMKELDNDGSKGISIGSSHRYISQESYKEFRHELDDLFARFRKRAHTDETIFPRQKLRQIRWLHCLAPDPSYFSSFLQDL
jgi:transcriptional regulator with XRE-family HTH domain